ncbi:hypothetical protein [Acinetobacter tianfuensis]|uniref:Carboxypeptidase regulatory-like domain-containing protein n=1 Tax=Acinetobacter tianfuensis TaxID=2419603 RepID=A0A3A8EDL3_9GAMM|nr:hypothetical protein [Acinetobacter tianfuensis]RKG32977.1 hypothetical protein D7V32_04055 [Acinetobacter tianfuensis]
MKPISRRILHSSNMLQVVVAGPVLAAIKGSTKKLGEKYKDSLVVLYSKANLQPITVRKPDANGQYQFTGLNANLKTFVVAFDSNHRFNAVIQDNVVPK